MWKAGIYKGYVCTVYVNDACSDKYHIKFNGEDMVVKKEDVHICSDNEAITKIYCNNMK